MLSQLFVFPFFFFDYLNKRLTDRRPFCDTANRDTIREINFTRGSSGILRAHVRITHQSTYYVYILYSISIYDIYIYIFAEFRYNVTCGWFSFVGLSVFDVGCYCWLLGV